MSATPLQGLLDRLHREERARLVGMAARILGDLDEAEAAVQDAFLAALEHWPREGTPARPGAWLLVATRRRALDALRRRRRAPLDLESCVDDVAAAADRVDESAEEIADDQLRLIFTCCHPALAREAQVALTLRLVAGLTTSEIAAAFLCPEATIAQRVVRAKRVLKERGLPRAAPAPAEWSRLLPGVLDVLYLVFNEGYSAAEGDDLLRDDLVESAVRLARMLVDLVPQEAEAWGLLALMELQASRGPARRDARGALVLLEDQDRSLWDRELIALGHAHLTEAIRRAAPGPLQVQAAIADRHAQARTWADTDWPAILALYDALREIHPSPVVDLNRAVAVAMVHGPDRALSVVDALLEHPLLASSHRALAVRADLLRRLARHAPAAAAYERAAALAENRREREFLAERAAQCAALAQGKPQP